jgi:hypothetical protein
MLSNGPRDISSKASPAKTKISATIARRYMRASEGDLNSCRLGLVSYRLGLVPATAIAPTYRLFRYSYMKRLPPDTGVTVKARDSPTRGVVQVSSYCSSHLNLVLGLRYLPGILAQSGEMVCEQAHTTLNVCTIPAELNSRAAWSHMAPNVCGSTAGAACKLIRGDGIERVPYSPHSVKLDHRSMLIGPVEAVLVGIRSAWYRNDTIYLPI